MEISQMLDKEQARCLPTGQKAVCQTTFLFPMSTRRLSSRTQRRVEVPMKQTLSSCTGPPVQCVHSVQRTQFAASGHVTGKQASWPVCRSPRIDALQHLDDRGKATFGLGDALLLPRDHRQWQAAEPGQQLWRQFGGGGPPHHLADSYMRNRHRCEAWGRASEQQLRRESGG